tara:strand:- start:3056 stop:3466 length:411 start_codon:yes stop_codon:yes gene_type:complete
MKNILKVLLSLTILVSCGEAQIKEETVEVLSCKDLRTGKFKYEVKEMKINTTVVRTDSLQIETELNSGIVFTYGVNWISDCVYTLQLQDCSQKLPEDAFNNLMTVNITETGIDNYNIVGTMSGKEGDFKVKIYKVD